MSEMKQNQNGPILVLGLGNPYLMDDQVGLLIAKKVKKAIPANSGVEVRYGSVAGFDLLDQLAGFSRAIIVDSIRTSCGVPGSIYRLLPEALPSTERLSTSHEINLPTALALGRLMGVDLPEETVIFAVEIEENRRFGKTCTPVVANAIDVAVPLVLNEALHSSVSKSAH